MTRISIVKNARNEITSFSASGHTNYGVEGEDIVCAAASSIVQTAALGILMVAQVEAKINRDDKKAKFELALPLKMTPQQNHDCATILKTMVCGLTDLQQSYSDFIELDYQQD